MCHSGVIYSVSKSQCLVFHRMSVTTTSKSWCHVTMKLSLRVEPMRSTPHVATTRYDESISVTHLHTQLIPPTDAQISKAFLCRNKTDSLHAHVYLNLSALKFIWILGLFKNVYTLLILRNEYISCHTCFHVECEGVLCSPTNAGCWPNKVFFYGCNEHISQALTRFTCILGYG